MRWSTALAYVTIPVYNGAGWPLTQALDDVRPDPVGER